MTCADQRIPKIGIIAASSNLDEATAGRKDRLRWPRASSAAAAVAMSRLTIIFKIILAGNTKIGLLKLFSKFSFFAAKHEKVVVSYSSLTFNRPGGRVSEEKAKPGEGAER